MLENDIIQAKIGIIQNCLRSIEQATNLDPEALEDQFTQDVFVINLQRAAQACIDIAHAIISERSLKLPASYAESFEILRQNKIIHQSTAEKMKKMTAFRNIAVHEYQQIDIDILKSILRDHLTDFENFYQQLCEESHKS